MARGTPRQLKKIMEEKLRSAIISFVRHSHCENGRAERIISLVGVGDGGLAVAAAEAYWAMAKPAYDLSQLAI